MNLPQKLMLFFLLPTSSLPPHVLQDLKTAAELSFTLGLCFLLQSTVSPQKGFPPPQLFDAAPYLPSVYPAAAHSVD